MTQPQPVGPPVPRPRRTPLTALEAAAAALAGLVLLVDVGNMAVRLAGLLDSVGLEATGLTWAVAWEVTLPSRWLLLIGIAGTLRRRATGGLVAAAVFYLMTLLSNWTIYSLEHMGQMLREELWTVVVHWVLLVPAAAAAVLLAAAQKRRLGLPVGALLALGLAESLVTMCLSAWSKVSLYAFLYHGESRRTVMYPWLNWVTTQSGRSGSSVAEADSGATTVLGVTLVIGGLSAAAAAAARYRRSHGFVAGALLGAVGVLTVVNLVVAGSLDGSAHSREGAASPGQAGAVTVLGSVLFAALALTVLAPGARQWLSAGRRPGPGSPGPAPGAAAPVGPDHLAPHAAGPVPPAAAAVPVRAAAAGSAAAPPGPPVPGRPPFPPVPQQG